jgi:MFS family permease
MKKFLRYYNTFIFCLTCFFLYADQNLLAPNLSAAASDFGFNEKQKDEMLGGDIALGFFLVGGPVALLVGYLADSVNRCKLFGLVVVFGESACFATYFVTNYWQLFFCRVLTGISIGGATPIIYSVLSDTYPATYRTYISVYVGLATGAGIAGGQLLSGLIGPSLGWKMPFLVISIPAILCGILAYFTAVEPVRGSQEREVKNLKERGHIVQENIEENKHENEPTISIIHKNFLHHSNSNEELKESPNMAELSSVLNPSSNLLENIAENIEEKNVVVENESIVEEEDLHVYSEKINCSKLKQLFSTPSVLLIFFQGFFLK